MKCWHELLNRINHPSPCGLVLVMWLWLGGGRDLEAQKPPGVGYVFPPVVTIGEQTDVQFGTYDITEDVQWFSHHPAVRIEIQGPAGDYLLTPPPYWIGPRASTNALPIPREIPARTTVDAKAKVGLARWQIANASGSSAEAVLYLSDEHEVIERRSRDFPQRLERLPVAVSGRLSRLTEVDRYEFTADEDGVVTAELMARQLGSDFLGVLEARDSNGRPIADMADTQGIDPVLSFRVRAGERYELRIHDADFRGHRSFVYRLKLTPGIRAVATIPARIEPGAEREIEFMIASELVRQGLPESIRRTVTVPQSGDAEEFEFRAATEWGELTATIPLSPFPEHVVKSSSDRGRSGQEVDFQVEQPIDTGIGLTGRVDESGSPVRIEWTAKAGQSWQVDLQSRGLGGSLDLAIDVLNPEGQVQASADDVDGLPDPFVRFDTPADGTYVCLIRCMSQRVETDEPIYRLQIARDQPGFQVTGPQQILLPSGGQTAIQFKVARWGGFTGPIDIRPQTLPAGVSVQGDWVIPENKNDARLNLQCAADAAVVAAPIDFVAVASIGESQTEQHVHVPVAGNLCPQRRDQLWSSDALLAMTMPAPFEVKVVDRERQRDVPRGTTSLTELQIVRKDGFDGALRIEMSARQSRDRQGILGGVVDVPPGVDEVLYPCFMPEWLGTDLTRRIVVHGVALVPDPQGNLRTVTAAADARITMILEGALLKLSADVRDLTLTAGEPCEIPISLSRSVKLPLPVTVTFEVPDELREVIQAEPLVLDPGTSRGVLRVTTVRDARLDGPWSFRLKARAMVDGKWPVISETSVSAVGIVP